jgi:hypothetical protein
MTDHPLKQALDEWLPEIDFGVLSHGFAPHGRDYVFVLQAAGTYELTLTHVVEMHYETRVRDDVWPRSWDDNFTDYGAWQAAGEPDGYVWGTDWSLAYPGLRPLEGDPSAATWSERLGNAMHAITLETDRYKLRLVFHSARARKLSEDSSIIDQVLVPLA